MGISPYICCPDGCSIFSDNFERVQIGCNWDIRDGWSLVDVDGETLLRESGNAGALIIAQRAVPRMSFRTGADSPSDVPNGAKYRVIVNYLDDDNYHFAEFEFVTDLLTIRLCKRTAGSNSTLLSQGWDVNLVGSPQSFLVCFTEKVFAAFQKYAPYAVWLPNPSPILGGYLAGLGNGAGVQIEYGSFGLDEHRDTNPDCYPCVCRCDDETPLPMQLTATLSFTSSLGACDPLEITLNAATANAYCEDETDCWYGTGTMDCSDCAIPQDPITFHVRFECGCSTPANKRFSIEVTDDGPLNGDQTACEEPSELECGISFLLTGYVTGSGWCSGQSGDGADLQVAIGFPD